MDTFVKSTMTSGAVQWDMMYGSSHGKAFANGVAGLVNKALDIKKKLEGDTSRNHGEKAVEFNRLAQDIKSKTQSMLSNFESSLNERHRAWSVADTALIAKQDANSFQTALWLSQQPTEKRPSYVEGDVRFLYAMNAVPSAISGVDDASKKQLNDSWRQKLDEGHFNSGVELRADFEAFPETVGSVNKIVRQFELLVDNTALENRPTSESLKL